MNNEKRTFEVIPAPADRKRGCDACCQSMAHWVVVMNHRGTLYICGPCLYALRDTLSTPKVHRHD